MNKKGILTVVSGFSGAGKGTIIKELMKNYDNYGLSISATTREPRNQEQHCQHYFFTERAEFERMIVNDELIEYATYLGNYYGTPRKYVEQQLEEGKHVILEIEIQGAEKVRNKYQDALLIFVTPPHVCQLAERLEKRGTETREAIQARLLKAVEEGSAILNYDYILVNDDLQECVTSLHEIVKNEQKRISRNTDLLKQLKNELSKFSGGE
jgi:guanylate kinase